MEYSLRNRMHILVYDPKSGSQNARRELERGFQKGSRRSDVGRDKGQSRTHKDRHSMLGICTLLKFGNVREQQEMHVAISTVNGCEYALLDTLGNKGP